MNFYLQNLIRTAQGKPAMTAREACAQLNKSAAPGARWVVKGSKEAKAFEKEDKSRRERELNESVRRRAENEKRHPNWDKQAICEVYNELQWMDHMWLGSISVSNGNNSTAHHYFQWMLKVASKKTGGAKWLRSEYGSDESWRMFHKARGWEHRDQMFDLDWGQSWERE